MRENAVKGPAKKRIGELLINAEIIDNDQLMEALELQKVNGKKTVENLIELGHVDLAAVAEFLSTQPGIPSIDLSNYHVLPELYNLIPRDFAVANELFPIDRMGQLLTVGMAFPLDSATIEKIEEMTGLRVKALLCRPDDIADAFNKYFVDDDLEESSPSEELSETVSRLEEIAALLREIDALPTLPRTVQRVQEAAASDETPIIEIAAIVSEDPAISAKLLKLANSAAYGFKNEVTSIEMATTLLGLDETCAAVMSSAIIDLTEKSKTFDHERFWAESMFCAMAAQKIAETSDVADRAVAFTAGLLCDIGRFALSEAAPERYRILEKGLLGDALRRVEEEHLGIGHPEAGFFLATQWNLPGDITEVIRFHERPERATTCADLVALVGIAARMTEFHFRGIEGSADLFVSMEPILNDLGLSCEDAESIFGLIQQSRPVD